MYATSWWPFLVDETRRGTYSWSEPVRKFLESKRFRLSRIKSIYIMSLSHIRNEDASGVSIDDYVVSKSDCLRY